MGCVLSLIFKLHVVDIHHVAILDTHLFQTGKQTALPQLHIEIVPGLVVIEIDVADQALQPQAGNHPSAAQMFDHQFLGIAGSCYNLNILRLLNGHRGQGAQLFCYHTHQVARALGSTCRDLIQLTAGLFHTSFQAL